MSTTPYIGSSAQRLTDMINADNQSSLVLNLDFTFGSPAAYSDVAGRNTKVILNPGNPTRYSPTEVHYTRLPLTVLNELPDGSIGPVPISGVPFKLSDILADINTALGLTLSVDEIQDTTYTQQQASYALPINEAVSLAWLNSDFTFSASFPPTGTSLTGVITQTDATDGGFDMVAPQYSNDRYYLAFLSTWAVSRRLFWNLRNHNYITYDSTSDSYLLASGQSVASIQAAYGANIVTLDGVTDLTDSYALSDAVLRQHNFGIDYE